MSKTKAQLQAELETMTRPTCYGRFDRCTALDTCKERRGCAVKSWMEGLAKMQREKDVQSPLVETLLEQLREAGLPNPTIEYQFEPTRKWRADLAYPEHKLLIEIEGGGFQGGRHTSIFGFLNDAEKYNRATVLGFRILRFHSAMITGAKMTKTLYRKSGKVKVPHVVKPCAVKIIAEALTVNREIAGKEE